MNKTKTNFHDDGSYTIQNIDDYSYLYFPLFNYFGMKSAITPTLHGDFKIDQNHFGMIPVSQDDLKNPLNARNIFFRVDNQLWNITGLTPNQKMEKDIVTLENGLLYQTIERENSKFKVKVTSFVPTINKWMELHKITFENISQKSLKVKTVMGTPIYGRSADNLRDHRQVTSLLNRIQINQNGIINHPSLSFDERGHQENGMAYGVFAMSSKHKEVSKYWPILQEFIGEGADLFYPDVPMKNLDNHYKIGDILSGYEAIGGLEFSEITLSPNEKLDFLLYFEMEKNLDTFAQNQEEYFTFARFDSLLEQNKLFWQNDLKTSDFHIGSQAMSCWLRQVGLQPLARRIYGNSYLPHHDYGRGGRGWRDLWQDSLELILKNPTDVRENIISYLKGVRIDGTNATIIGSNKGEFLADRNHIVRVWSDHGAWPFMTTNLYIQRTGDLDLLFEKEGYFKDKFSFYTRQVDTDYQEADGHDLLTRKNIPYKGTVLEHILIENLTAFFNVGKHGNIRIEDGDWNDGFDMASKNGETVAFTFLYTGNLTKIIVILDKLREKGIQKIELLEEILLLLDTIDSPISYDNPIEKQKRLFQYFSLIKNKVSGTTVLVDIDKLILDLEKKYLFMKQHLNENEWLSSPNKETGFYNGYYNNNGVRVESANPENIRMTLTGQVFPLMAKVASTNQITKIIESTKKYLFDSKINSYHLNTDFGENKMDLGRFMGFAYGHKENGAFFSHMTLMYAYSLLENGFVFEGNKVIEDIYLYSIDIQKSKILPGIPEYFDPLGRGMYHYLTGSASWVILSIVEQVYGIDGCFGDFVIKPKLLKHHFREGIASLNVVFHSKLLHISFLNPSQLEYGTYQIEKVLINDKLYVCHNNRFVLTESMIEKDGTIKIVLEGKK
ncbi:MAG: cellobiose phosphorylase [Firmicutes bacterium]|nr:cellobiose phosphorylase [Bacillota bacterium]